jgi:hypothetical protein
LAAASIAIGFAGLICLNEEGSALNESYDVAAFWK